MTTTNATEARKDRDSAIDPDQMYSSESVNRKGMLQDGRIALAASVQRFRTNGSASRTAGHVTGIWISYRVQRALRDRLQCPDERLELEQRYRFVP